MKYEQLVKDVLFNIGGKENLDFANHCATRLRLKVKDISKVNQQGLKTTKNILGLVVQEKELQIIIGTHVNQVYNEFVDAAEIEMQKEIKENLDEDLKSDKKQKLTVQGAFNTAVDFVSAVFVPVLPVLVAAGLVSAVITIATNFFGMDTSGGTATILSSINSAGFYFLPIFLGFFTARKLKISPAMGAFLGAILVCSTINGVEGLNFLGIPVYTASYNGTTLPVIFGVLFMAVIDKGIDKYIPKEIKFFAKPLITILVVVPVTVLLLAPAGAFLSNYINAGIIWLSNTVGFFTVAIFAVFNPLMVMCGLDKALASIVLASLANNGYEAICLVGSLTSNTAIGGAALAVWWMSKNADTKALGLSAGITGVLGITEPSLFGICLRFKKPLFGAMIGGAIGGLFAGLVQLKQYALVSPGLAATPTYISPDGTMINFYLALAAIAISVVSGFIATILLSRNKKEIYNG